MFVVGDVEVDQEAPILSFRVSLRHSFPQSYSKSTIIGDPAKRRKAAPTGGLGAILTALRTLMGSIVKTPS